MLSTKQLEDYILNELKDKPDMTIRDLHFCDGHVGCLEGIYVFSQDGKYILMTMEKGAMIDQYETTDKRELLWKIVENISINAQLRYAMDNSVRGRDYRRAMFKKRLEIFSRFGKDFKHKAEKEVNEILEKYPYNDCE